MEINMKDNSKTTKNMAMAHFNGRTVAVFLDGGMMANSMG
jgi:hypothetical protein